MTKHKSLQVLVHAGTLTPLMRLYNLLHVNNMLTPHSYQNAVVFKDLTACAEVTHGDTASATTPP